MAASMTKTLPRAINYLISKRLGGLTLACCCNNTRSLSQFVPTVLRTERRNDRHLFTYSQLRQYDMVKQETDAVEPMAKEVAEEVLEEDELDVLYKKIIVEVKGHDRSVLKSYEQFVILASKHLEIRIGKISKPDYHVFRRSVNKSVFVHKKHFSQFEQRTHFLVFEIPKLTGSTADTFLEYIQRNLPEGVAMKVTRHRLEKLPDHLKPPLQEEKTNVDRQILDETNVTDK